MWTRLERMKFIVVLVVSLASFGLVCAQTLNEVGEMVQFAVSPSRFELEMGTQPTMHSLRLMNMGSSPAEVQVSVVPWRLDEQNQVELVEPSEQSLDQWIVFNPSRFTVVGNSSQTVRFSIRPRVRPEPGEHRAMIYLEQVLPQSNAKTIRVNFKVGVAVYAYFGDIDRAGSVNGVEARASDQHIVARVDIESLGNAHVRMNGDYYIWPVTTFPGENQILQASQENRVAERIGSVVGSGKLPTLPVLPGTRRNIPVTANHNLEPGEYVLALIGELSGRSFSKATAFRVPEPEPKAPRFNQVAQAPPLSTPEGSPSEEPVEGTSESEAGDPPSDGGGGN